MYDNATYAIECESAVLRVTLLEASRTAGIDFSFQ
jgi:hypothetical protein